MRKEKRHAMRYRKLFTVAGSEEMEAKTNNRE
jgi:hypothetical protein